MPKDHGPQIKDDEQYQALREKGMSKEKAARIANADRGQKGHKGGKSGQYEDWNKEDLYAKAKDLGLDVNKNMRKGEVIDRLRHH
jgi:hypothetical protein